MPTPYLIGISGGSASGKTLLLRKIREIYHPGQVCIMSMDDYYRLKKEQLVDEKGFCNFDTPESIDNKFFLSDLISLKSGQPVEKQEYTFNNPSAKPAILTLKPAPVIIAEGIFILCFSDIIEQLDLKIFIDAKDHIRLKRRIHRDIEERGYDLEDVLYRYEYHVAPTYEKYIEPAKHLADIIIPNNSEFSKAFDLLTTYIGTKLHD